MLNVPGFTISEQLHQGSRAVVYRARRAKDDLPVVLKAPRSPRPTLEEAGRLRAELRLGQLVQHPAVIRYHELVWDQHRPVLVIEDFGGEALSALIEAGPLSLPRFFELALGLAEGLAAIHGCGIIHRDINPSNVVCDRGGAGRAKIIDLGIAALLAHSGEAQDAPPQQIEGTLRYISPEQTGRMNRSVDHRTDLYSLGVTFYELLAGRVPFEAQDPLELVHAHLARTPPSLRPSDLPDVVVDIVARLLAKTPEERYQSADGLAEDLRRCRQTLTGDGDVPSFALGQRDVSSRFALPEKLYGREAELEQLLGALERAHDGGRILLSVTGRSGSGKTALLRELQQLARERGAFFVRGRFDSQRRETPHSAFIEVGAELVRRVLTLSEDHIDAFREQLQRAMGEAGQVLIDVLPQVELLIGPQTETVSLPQAEAELRFNRLACAFFALFADARHTLVLQLDDLQWADAASLKLIELLMAERELHHLLLVGSYRTDELTPTHALSLALRAVATGPAETEQLELGPLGPEELTALLADTLGAGSDDVRALAETLHAKTLGNPLFVAQFLRALHAEGLLRFDPEARAWRWDAAQIAARKVSDDVAELLLARMNRLPEATRQVIELAACAGHRFDLATLEALAERPLGWVAEAIQPAIEGGVLRACCAGYGRLVAHLAARPDDGQDPGLEGTVRCEFVHPRFQQAAYGRTPAARRQQLHLRLGRMLRRSLGAEALQERIYEVVQHFEAGLDGLDDPAERLEVARLCLAAGERALASSAYATAIHHYEAGAALLPQQGRWEEHYELTFELLEQRYFAQMMTRAPHEEGMPLARELVEHARGLTHRMRVMGGQIVDLSRLRRVEEALELGAAPLRELGLELLPDDLPQAILQAHDELEQLLGGRELAELVDLPPMTDPEKIAAMRLLGAMSMPIYMRHRELLPLQAMANVKLTLEHGNGEGSAMAYCTYGKVLAHTFGDYNLGYAFGRLGRRLSDKLGAFRAGTRLVTVMIDWVREPLHEVVERMRRTVRMGVEGGEFNFAAICASMTPSFAFCAGTPLEPLLEEGRGYVELITQHQGDVGVREIDLNITLCEALLGQRPRERALFDSEDEAERALEVMRVRNPEGVVWYHTQRARLELLFGDPRRALEHADAAYGFVDWEMGHFGCYDLDFLHALALARCLDEPEPADVDDLRRRLEQRSTQLQGWVDGGAGTNLRHKALLVAAELCRLRGERGEVGAAYERAIQAAAASGMIQDQALANELAARHYDATGLEKVARVYLQEAYYCYQKWGAAAKLRLMEREHPSLGRPERSTGTTTTYATDGTVQSTTRTTTGDRAPALDYSTVLEAARAISGEVVLADLLRKLLAISAENAGAERAFLLLRGAKALTVEAAWEPGDEAVRLLAGVALADFDQLSAGVANYVVRTRESVVLDNAGAEGRFQSDPYITRQSTRSLLCAPLTNQGRVVGLLYLENNLVSGVFSPDRLELVELLCSQAAISIDNASLYAELEQKVEARTRDLARKNEQLNESLERQSQMQNQLLISEKMASLGNLVAGVAHELNTPIGAVVASVDTAARALEKLRAAVDLEAAPRGPRLVTLLEDSHRVIHTAGERVSEIVRTLRNFARLDEAERKTADLHEGIDSTLELLHHRIKHGVKVVKAYGELPEVLCYPNQLNQVFMNLLVNAVDAVALPENGAASTGGTIQIRTWLSDGAAHVAISDDGPGIPADVRARIFDPGFTTKGVGVGTGLGLSICFSIMDKHGGAISVDSTPGQGSTFTVRVPVGQAG
jgi:predicted ATPase/signal transduction histidine kinase/tRNA A-37 threonylcarbamoyl transferase component Bud32